MEQCRASKDLSTCGRYVQHALSSCGHASLCEQCSQRCDVCPICRTPLAKGGKLRLRLYDKCIEAGIISRQDDVRSEQNYYGEHLDVQRLYSLFDVALENNLVSSICHCILFLLYLLIDEMSDTGIHSKYRAFYHHLNKYHRCYRCLSGRKCCIKRPCPCISFGWSRCEKLVQMEVQECCSRSSWHMYPWNLDIYIWGDIPVACI